jgi:hypothetical protein
LILLVCILAGSSGLCVAGALDRIALYIGNNDHIPLDLALPFDLRDQAATAFAVAAPCSGTGRSVSP